MKVQMLLIVAIAALCTAGLAMAQGATPPANPPPDQPAAQEPAKAEPQKTKEDVKMADLPEAVQKAVQEQIKGIKDYKLVKETEGDKVAFEVKMKIKGLEREVEFDPDGKLLEIEQEVKLASLPAKAKKAITTGAGKGKILKVETVTVGDVVTYKAKVQTGKETTRIRVDKDGNPVQK